MSFKLRLFLMFGCLIAALVAAQWLFMRAMTRDVFEGVGDVAVSVGQGLAGVMVIEELGEDSNFEVKQNTRLKRIIQPSVSISELHVIQEDTRSIKHKSEDGEVILDITTREFAGQSGDVWVSAHASDDTDGTEANTFSFAWKKEFNEAGEGPRVRHVLGTGEHSIVVMLDEDPSQASRLLVERDGTRQEIPLPRHNLDQAVTRTSTYMLAGSLMILLLGLAGGGYLAHRIAHPMARLASAAREVGGGALGHTVRETAGPPEVNQAILSFNAMSLRLQELDKLARRNEQEKNLSELGEIARGLAHTIRNPLNTLGLSVEQLAEMSGGNPDSRALVDSAQTQIRRIDQWIRSFLAMASEGMGQSEPLDVGGLVQDVVLEAIQDNGNKARLEVNVAENLPTIQGVPPELRAVIQALVVNAVEASPVDGTVWVSAEKEDRAIRIEVIDQGTGVPPEVRERLFTPHVTTKTQGSGMGLFLAHRITTGRYRGSLALDDLSPSGTRAVLILPEENGYDEQDQNSRC